MCVLVAGAAGAIGRRLIPRLVAAGHEVTATTRTAAKAEQLRRLGAEPLVVDGLDAAAVTEAVAHARPDAIVHQMAALAAEDAAGEPGGDPLHRTGRAGRSDGGHRAALWQSLRPRRLRVAGGADPQAPNAGDRRRRRRLVVDHLDGAAAATVAALERGARGVYNITDDAPAAVGQWLPYLAQVAGAKAPPRVPAWLARPMPGALTVRWMTQGRGSSNQKAKRELNWQPTWPSWREGFRGGLEEQRIRA
jgi:nucleoside-diphosphate-sugar epimerase